MIVSESNNEERIFSFLESNDIYFVPNLSSRIELKVYAKKIANNSFNIFLTNENGKDIGHAAVYINSGSASFLTSFCIDKSVYGKGVSSILLRKVFNACLKNKSDLLELEVDYTNQKAINFYEKNGFVMFKENEESQLMSKKLD